MGQTRLPPLGRIGQPLGGDAVQGQQVVDDVGRLGKLVLGSGDHEIEALNRRPGPSQQHEPRASAGLTADPAGNHLVALMRQQHEIGPRCLEGVGVLAIDAQEMLASQQLERSAEGAMRDALDLVRATERLGQGQELGALAGSRRGQHPNPRCHARRECSRAWQPELASLRRGRGAQGGGGTQRHDPSRGLWLPFAAAKLVTRHTWRDGALQPTH